MFWRFSLLFHKRTNFNLDQFFKITALLMFWKRFCCGKKKFVCGHRPALPQQVEDVVSESVSVLLQHPPHVVHHLPPATGGRQRRQQVKTDVFSMRTGGGGGGSQKRGSGGLTSPA